ncbi:hypothetical protein CH063_00493 [Colletotrichum higginsianum]|uniref:Uncharacterized protein n=1 Tax=Colletotrichum higginsianum (strain IMI 349063) TaxID=759273 RepID=H1VUI8_COLHI|nr:hypothetical protein CH063_00493 [Colletotrichum higginsianum]
MRPPAKPVARSQEAFERDGGEICQARKVILSCLACADAPAPDLHARSLRRPPCAWFGSVWSGSDRLPNQPAYCPLRFVARLLMIICKST